MYMPTFGEVCVEYEKQSGMRVGQVSENMLWKSELFSQYPGRLLKCLWGLHYGYLKLLITDKYSNP